MIMNDEKISTNARTITNGNSLKWRKSPNCYLVTLAFSHDTNASEQRKELSIGVRQWELHLNIKILLNNPEEMQAAALCCTQETKVSFQNLWRTVVLAGESFLFVPNLTNPVWGTAETTRVGTLDWNACWCTCDSTSSSRAQIAASCLVQGKDSAKLLRWNPRTRSMANKIYIASSLAWTLTYRLNFFVTISAVSPLILIYRWLPFIFHPLLMIVSFFHRTVK